MEPKKKLKKFNDFKNKKNSQQDDFFYLARPAIYRYLMEFPLGDRMFNWYVNSETPQSQVLTRRTYNFNTMNELAPIHQWVPIQVKFRDFIGSENHKNEFYNRLRTWFNDFNHTGRKINTTISRLDPTGTVVSRWDLRGCFVSALHYGNLNFDNHEPELEITLHYDYCNLSVL